jgi:hypothetical protein
MPIIESLLQADGASGEESAKRSPVTGVNAHLRIPRDPAEFRVVITFHHVDGLLCEAELTPNQADELMAGIGRAIYLGDTNELESQPWGKGGRRV